MAPGRDTLAAIENSETFEYYTGWIVNGNANFVGGILFPSE
jgi:hypothetical protein